MYIKGKGNMENYEKELLNKLYDTYGKSLYLLANHRLGEDRAKDAVQMVFLIATVKIDLIIAHDITLSQFFAESEMTELTPDLQEVFDHWAALTLEQREAILMMMRLLHNKNQK